MKRIVSYILIFSLLLLALPAQAAKIIPVMSWEELLSRIEKGESPLYLGANLTGNPEAPIEAQNAVTIIGNGFSLTSVTVSKGQVQFSDVAIFGRNGMNDENGGTALTVCGKDTVAVFSASASAVGGRSGVSGLQGGHGIVIEGENCGVILRGSASASGGTGRFAGGSAIAVSSCASSVLLTDSAALVGGTGSNEGSPALVCPACCKVQLTQSSSLAGGDGYLLGGNGVHALACETCSTLTPIEISGSCVSVGGMGIDGGDGVYAKGAHLVLKDTPMFFGGAGQTSGYALNCEDSDLDLSMDSLMLFGGGYSGSPSPVSSYGLCRISGSADLIAETPGSQLSAMPAEQVPERVETALRQKTGRESVEEVSLSITSLPLTTRANDGRLQADKGKVGQAQVSGTTLKLRVFNITNENYFSFSQRFYEQDGEIYYILIADQSQEGYTVNASLAALKKLSSLGVTHFVYTSVAPIYCERILNLDTLLADMEEAEYEIDKILFGTADDCVIYVDKDGNHEYRVDLMGEALCPVPAAPEAEEAQSAQ